jgi:Holliday junction resolvase-like predicted endonuclease
VSSTVGASAESKSSAKFHFIGTPFLISSLFLRSRGLGQVDIAYFHKNILSFIEVKNSALGVSKLYNSTQISRLNKAAKFFSIILDVNTRVKSVAQKESFAKYDLPH